MKRKRLFAMVSLVPAAALALMMSGTGAEGRGAATAALKTVPAESPATFTSARPRATGCSWLLS